MDAKQLGGVVLCGGQSRRMGSPKAWLLVDGEPLLARMVRAVAGAASEVVVAAAVGQELPTLIESVRIVRDAQPELGPLAGMAAAFAGLRAPTVFVAACDLPALSTGLILEIAAGLANEHQAAVPIIDGRPQPLAAAYRRDLLPLIQEHLAARRLALHELLECISWKPLENLPAAAFRNLNSPSDLAAFQRESPP